MDNVDRDEGGEPRCGGVEEVEDCVVSVSGNRAVDRVGHAAAG